MFSDPQFWVAVSFFLFIVVIFNPVRKLLVSSLDTQIDEIKTKISESDNLKNEAERTLSELKQREIEVMKEIQVLNIDSDKKIQELKEISSKKYNDQIEKRKILAENKIDQLIRDTNLTIKTYITNTSIEITANILKRKLTIEKKSDLINKSMRELDSILKN